MIKKASRLALIKALLSKPQILRTKPTISLFLCQYLRKFPVMDVGGRLVLHSHLPPINSKAYSRFINEHLLAKIQGPSHAQIALTNACPQNCDYCYNKRRTGTRMDTPTILRVIQELKQMGVFWLGFTGGEPLLNRDIVRITESVGDGCALKLFTTGCHLTPQLAADLRNAGLIYVSVSLDHWQEAEHDRVRNYAGAFRTALQAIEIFKGLGDMHVSVSAVLSKEMIRNGQVEEFLQFLIGLDIHEAWLSEAKPSFAGLWKKDAIIAEDERLALVAMQDRYNKEGKITVNYLGHFEGKEHFGCCAGHKMVYVDAFGYVSPCVFTPITFGNVREREISNIFRDMRRRFPSESRCFINTNYGLIKKHYHGVAPLPVEETLQLMQEVEFASYSKFMQLLYH